MGKYNKVFNLLFTFMTSIIIFFKIYSEALQAIKISTTTFIIMLFSWIPSMEQ